MAFGFVSEGADANQALQQFLLLREQQDRQAQQDALAQAEREAAGKRAQEQINLTRANQEELRRQAGENEGYRRVYNMVSGKGTPGVVDASVRDEANKYGLGGSFNETKAEQGSYLGDDESGVPQYQVLPGVINFKGGWQYQADEEAQRERGELARQQQQAQAALQAQRDAEANERAEETNTTRMMIAASAAQGRNANADLDRQIKEGRIAQQEAEATKTREATDRAIAADNNAREGIAAKSQEMMNLIGQLVERDPKDLNKILGLKPGAARLYGAVRTPDVPYFGHVGSQNENATLNTLTANTITDFLNYMKNQSRTGATGFGALNQEELKIIVEGAGKLKDRHISPEEALNELMRIYEKANLAKDRATKGMERRSSDRAPAGGGVTITSIEEVR